MAAFSVFTGLNARVRHIRMIRAERNREGASFLRTVKPRTGKPTLHEKITPATIGQEVNMFNDNKENNRREKRTEQE